MPPVIRPIAIEVALENTKDADSVLARIGDAVGSISLIRHFRIPVVVDGSTIVVDVGAGKTDEGADEITDEITREIDTLMRRMRERYPITHYAINR